MEVATANNDWKMNSNESHVLSVSLNSSFVSSMRKLSKSLKIHNFALGLVFLIVIQYSSSDVQEYCFPNTFNVSCSKDEVVVMMIAKYGRMKKGKCITSEYHIGCWIDVLMHVDQRCSGRHECFINIPDTTLHQIQPCPKDMLAYLEADYTCRKVQTRLPYPCNHFGEPQVLTESKGSLASIVVEDLGYGSSRCPWIVSVPRGRRINFTLEDFGLAARHGDAVQLQQQQQQSSSSLQQRRYHRQLHHQDLREKQRSTSCQVYATLQELDPVQSSVTEVTSCGPKTRERHILISESARVEVILMAVRIRNEPVYFVIKYEAVGCSDPLIPRGSYMRREGIQATVNCNFTSQSWHIVCQGDTWFGSIENCSIEVPTIKSSIVLSETTEIYPLGLLVAVMVGLVLGVLIGVMLLTLVLSCHKRYYSKKRLREAKELSSQRVVYGTRREAGVVGEAVDDVESNTTYCPTFGATTGGCINGSLGGGSCAGTAVRGRGVLDSIDRIRYTHVCGLGISLPTCEHLTMSPG